MIHNYLKIAWRNLLKNKVSSIINISGLGMASGCCLVVFVFLDWSFNQDSFHSKLENLFVLERTSEKDGTYKIWGDSPMPMGHMLKAESPQISNVSRIHYEDGIIKDGDKIFREHVSFVDDSFYEMFDFPIKWGNKHNFTQQNGIVLTEELSEKIFNNKNSIGKNVNIRFNKNGKEIEENFTVSGVLQKKPYETSFYFSALIPIKKMIALGLIKTDDWTQMSQMTFIETKKESGTILSITQEKKYLDIYNKANKNSQIENFHLQPLKSMNLHSYKLINSYFFSTHIIGIIMLLTIALSILILVCFNYINIAIASAAGRLKEIGVRKAIGSTRKQIIYQFILEHLILCSVAVLFGLVLAKFVFIPWFSQIANLNLNEKLFSNPNLWLTLLGLIFIAILGGAAYPSIYISAFKPISIVQKSFVLGDKNRFRKSLLGVQFFLTFLGVSMAFAFVKENKLAKTKNWGYQPIDNVVTKMEDSTDFEVFRTALENDSKITSLTASIQPLGKWTKQLLVRSEGIDCKVQNLGVLPGFIKHMEITILEGRDLNEDMKTDFTSSVLVNQAFMKKMNWTSITGKSIEFDNKKYNVVGLTNDFYFESFEYKISPLIFSACLPADVKFVYAKTLPNSIETGRSVVEKIWLKTFSNRPFDYYQQDMVFEQYFSSFIQGAKVLSATSLIMIVVSISGIFGLALLILGKKMKELSVRKILGAGIFNVCFQILKEFLWPLIIAFMIGFPMSYLLTKNIFDTLSPESSVTFLPLVVTCIALVAMTIFSVLWHLYKAYSANPVKYLKNE
ncbi:MAG: ABC transporter permease [Saprospiraceae bacterium]|nr:ABC transporter permease [Saprospiraceae bacterium]